MRTMQRLWLSDNCLILSVAVISQSHQLSTTVSRMSRRRPGLLRHNSLSSMASDDRAPVAAGLARKSMGDIGSLAPIIRRRSILLRELLEEHAVSTSRLPSLMDIAYPGEETSALPSRSVSVFGQQSSQRLQVDKTKAATKLLTSADDQLQCLGAVRNTREVSRHQSPLRLCNSLSSKSFTAGTVGAPVAPAMLRSLSTSDTAPKALRMRRRSSLLRELVEEDVMSRLPSLTDDVYPEWYGSALPSMALKSNMAGLSSTFGELEVVRRSGDEKAAHQADVPCPTPEHHDKCCDAVANTREEVFRCQLSPLRHNSFTSSRVATPGIHGAPVASTTTRRSMGDIDLTAPIMRLRRSSLLRELVEEDVMSRLPNLMDDVYPEEPRAHSFVAAKSRTRWASGLGTRTVPQDDEKAKAVGTKESPKLIQAMRNIPLNFVTRMAQTGIMSN